MPRQAPRQPAPRAVEPLNRELLVRRSSEAFPSANLTFISIIQGVALGYTIYNCVHGFPAHGYLAQVSFAARGGVQFVALVIAAWEYTWFGVVLRWPAGFIDSFVPLTMGAFEIIPTFFLGRPFLWWLFEGMFLVAASASYLSSLLHCRPDMYELPEAYKATKRELRINLSILGVTIAVAVAAMLLIRLVHFSHPVVGIAWVSLGGCGLMVALGGGLILAEERAQTRLHAIHGLIR